jgi:Fe-S oxidoreductase
VKYGVTIPLGGDYSFARVDVMLTCPCYKEEMGDVYKQVRKAVDKILDNEVKRLEEGQSGQEKD